MAQLAADMRFDKGEVDFTQVKKDLTIKFYDRIAEEYTTIHAYRQTSKHLYVPREYGLELAFQKRIEYVDRTEDGVEGAWEEATPVVLRDYQIPWVDQLHKEVMENYDVRAQAGTGMGKTVMSLEVARRLGVSTVVVVDQEFLRDQWFETASELFGLGMVELGLVQGSTLEYEGCSLVVAMIQTLHSRKLPKEFYEHFGAVIFDECHTVGAPVFAKALSMFPATMRWGISATPNRGDPKDKLLEWHLGSVSVVLAQQHRKSVIRYLQSYSVYSWYAATSPKTGRYINEVAGDMDRNWLISQAIYELYGSGRTILALSDRIEHLEVIRALLLRHGAPDEDIGVVARFDRMWRYAKDTKPKAKPKGWDGEAPFTPVKMQVVSKRKKTTELDRLKDECPILLATYQMFSKGVDVPEIDTGIDITPRSKAQQQHGRILRELKGKRTPIWVTIRDVNSSRGEYQFLQRLQEYAKSNVEVYEWRLDKGTKQRDIKALQAAVKTRHQKLKECRITTRLDGRSTLAIPTLLTRPGSRPETATERTTRRKGAG